MSVDFIYIELELTLDAHAITHNNHPGIKLTNGFSCRIWVGIDNASQVFNAFEGINYFCAQEEKFVVIGFLNTTEAMLEGNLTLEYIADIVLQSGVSTA